MALVLDATASGASSNSYSTVAEADSYHDGHLYSSDWSSATTTQKETGLVMATGLLNTRVSWNGAKATSTQALRWPRTYIFDPDGYPVSSTSVPTFLKEATAEFARHLIAKDRTAESGTEGFSQIMAGKIELRINKSDRALVIPPSVWAMITWYGAAVKRQSTLVRI